jgi:hypothetical protein
MYVRSAAQPAAEKQSDNAQKAKSKQHGNRFLVNYNRLFHKKFSIQILQDSLLIFGRTYTINNRILI